MNRTVESRAARVAVALVLTASVTGYFAGVRGAAPVREYRAPRARFAGEIESAPTYGQEREARRDNRARHGTNLVALENDRPALYDPVPPTDDATREAALRRRSERRAYDGAPPVIPHPIDQGAYPNCASCHERGMRIGDRVAPMMSHPRYENCYQCHVVSARPMPGPALSEQSPPFLDNSFVGMLPASLRAPNATESTVLRRWWAGAPPLTPHPTLMRARCESCHGVLSAGIRSTHPWRQNCLQCHGVSAALNQAPNSFNESPMPAALISSGPPVANHGAP